MVPSEKFPKIRHLLLGEGWVSVIDPNLGSWLERWGCARKARAPLPASFHPENAQRRGLQEGGPRNRAGRCSKRAELLAGLAAHA